MPRKPGQKNENVTQPNAPAASFAPGADWLTIKQAAVYMFGEDARADVKRHQSIRNAVKGRAEFKNTDDANPDRVRHVPIEGMDIPPITYINTGALDAYKAALASGNTGSRVGRVGDNGRRYVIRVKDDNKAAVQDALDAFGITMESGTSNRKSKNNGTTDTAGTASNNGTADVPVSTDVVPAEVTV